MAATDGVYRMSWVCRNAHYHSDVGERARDVDDGEARRISDVQQFPCIPVEEVSSNGDDCVPQPRVHHLVSHISDPLLILLTCGYKDDHDRGHLLDPCLRHASRIGH